jgi:8-oxo-dGTP pyrophosphatase MutT (NUDIX family)
MDIRVAAYGVIVRDGEILLAHWSQGGLSGWTLPGGGIDPGEDPADAAVREILEETGYTATLDSLLGVDSIVIPTEQRLSGTGPLHGLRIVYRADVVSGELTNEIDGSTDEARWFRLGDLARLDTVDLVETGLRMLVESAR